MSEAARAYDPAADDVDVRDVPDRDRFELLLGSEPVGFVTYRREGDTLALLHAEVDPAYGGHGLGSMLVTSVLDQLADRGEQVLPYCSFIRMHVRRDEARHAMVPADERSRFGLA